MNKVTWDYTNLAKHYDKRAEYASDAIEAFIRQAKLGLGDPVADVGAGTGKLTTQLLRLGLKVTAVEPNDEMRKFGIQNTKGENVGWKVGTGEQTGLNTGAYKAVTFGSSFNVTDRMKTLEEVKRIVVPQGWFACMWNHRDLEDSIQKEVETAIQRRIPSYSYGTRREDQREFLEQSGFLKSVNYREGSIVHTTSTADYIDAWRSHATLERQAGKEFQSVIRDIETILKGKTEFQVPYTTRLWYGQLR